VSRAARELVSKALNPEYKLRVTPIGPKKSSAPSVSGRKPPYSRVRAGYGGPFKGPGFDSIWTDMSEIVRPTCDGIHGREYISTTVDLEESPVFIFW
jgi:hypothetical protein